MHAVGDTPSRDFAWSTCRPPGPGLQHLQYGCTQGCFHCIVVIMRGGIVVGALPSSDTGSAWFLDRSAAAINLNCLSPAFVSPCRRRHWHIVNVVCTQLCVEFQSGQAHHNK